MELLLKLVLQTVKIFNNIVFRDETKPKVQELVMFHMGPHHSCFLIVLNCYLFFMTTEVKGEANKVSLYPSLVMVRERG